MNSTCSRPEWSRTPSISVDWRTGLSMFPSERRRHRPGLCGRDARLVWRASSAFLALILVLLVVQGCILQSFYVPSSSMTPTLQVDDCIVVPKLAYGLHLPFADKPLISWDSPQRGNVVVFHREDDRATPIDESSSAMVKRVIGIAGDTVTIVGRHVFVNGEVLQEPYARWMGAESAEVVSFAVPDGALFLLGDNRDESDDSRFWSDPFVPLERVLGPATAVYWSASRAARMVY
jgi:signal peptidase I